MALKHRKIRKKRGSRLCGKGANDGSRGAGNRGGKGMAGGHKSKWTWIVKYAPDHFGREKGFKLPYARRYKTVNVGDLDQGIETFLERKIASKKGKLIEIDVTKLNYDKVLGKGKVTRALTLKAHHFSDSAKKKIEDAGGKCILLEG